MAPAAVGAFAVDPVGDSLGERALHRVGLGLGQGAVLHGGNEVGLRGGDHGFDECVNADLLVLRDVRQALATLHRGAQLVGGHAEGLRGCLMGLGHAHPAEVSAGTAHSAHAAHAAVGKLGVKGGGDLVGLSLGQGAVLDQAGQRALDAGKPAGDHVVRGGGGGGGDGHGADGAGGENAGENESNSALVQGVLLEIGIFVRFLSRPRTSETDVLTLCVGCDPVEGASCEHTVCWLRRESRDVASRTLRVCVLVPGSVAWPRFNEETPPSMSWRGPTVSRV